MKRLTSERCNGIKSGYWSPAKKEDLIQRLGAYEDTGLEPEEIRNAAKDNHVPTKTADEMFRELGYREVESGYLKEYRKTEPNGNIIRICIAHGNNMSMTCAGKAFWMIDDEVIACAELIKEMRNG